MNDPELARVLALDGEERYDYFLSRVAEDRELWILVNADNRFLKIAAEDNVEYVPVWPDSVFAAGYAGGADGLVPKSLSLPDFFRKWVTGLSRDGLDVGVFPGLDRALWITDPEELKRDLQDAMADF